MHLRDLPSDILHLVFREAFAHHSIPQPLPKRAFSPLAVCQRWRRVALPVAHSSVTIRYGIPTATRLHGSYADTMPQCSRMVTNLDLVAAAGCTGSVRSVDIVVDHAENMLRGLKKVVHAMRTAAERWGGVRELQIILPSCLAAPNGYTAADMAQFEKDIFRICTALSTMMPRVCRTKFHSGTVNPIAQRLYGQLTAHYCGQLREVRLLGPAILPPGCMFGQLRHALVKYIPENDYQPYQMDPSKLVSLTIFNTASVDPWAPFSTAGSRDIVFASLENLTISDVTEDPANGDAMQSPDEERWMLCFPRLKKLEFICMRGTHSLLEHAVLPSHMDMIYIAASMPVLMATAEVQLPVTRILQVEIEIKSEEHDSMLAAANRIFENARGAEELRLTIQDSQLPLLPESISCTLLTDLVVHASTSVDTMLGLIQKLPNLNTAYFSPLDFSSADADLSAPDAGCQVEPLNTRIKTLALDVGPSQWFRNMLVPTIKHLAPRILTLKNLYALQAPEKPIMEFVDVYSKWYPHLVGTKFRLDDSADSCADATACIPNIQSLLLGGGPHAAGVGSITQSAKV